MKVLEYLKTQSIAVVSTVSSAGLPQAATVLYATRAREDGHFELYFATREHTRKYVNIVSNPEVAVVIGTDIEKPYTVQLQGKAELVKKEGDESPLDFLQRVGAVSSDLAQSYTDSFFFKSTFMMLKGIDFAFFKVTPTWVRFMHPDEDGKGIVYTQVVE